MVSFKGVLKYSIYLFIVGWMFLLGIMVGRGFVPEVFDTQTQQLDKRLHSIASEVGQKKENAPQRVELQFYDALKQPVAQDVKPSSAARGGASGPAATEIHPKPEPDVPVQLEKPKVSLKKKTYNADIKLVEPPKAVPAPKKVAKKPKIPAPVPGKTGRYLIQIAAYQNFKDAVARMAKLEEQGFKAYREKIQIGSKTWYRVRIGFFETYDDARKYEDRLKKAKIDGMIRKKETP